MKQSLQLRLGQQLTMTPQLQQAIRMLQLSNLELTIEIQQALESNPMLDEIDDYEHNIVDEIAEESQPTVIMHEIPDQEINVLTGEYDSSEGELDLKEGIIPTVLAVDSNWEDSYDLGNISINRSHTEDEDYQEPGKITVSLHEHLLSQVELAPFSSLEKEVALAIVDAIDDNGYLICTLKDIQATLPELTLSLNNIEAVLQQVQHFDPVGVAARNPQECLLLQLTELPPATPWLQEAKILVRDHLALLARRDFIQLMRHLKLAEDDLRQVINLIQQLNPHPGAQLADIEQQYIIPDVIVTHKHHQWKVELSYDPGARLRVHPYYASLVRRADYSADNSYLRSQLQEARWFLKSLQSRNETLLKVANAIVERQLAFLELGAEAMRPLVLRDIAEVLGMHESTISRVTNQKYMNTPQGIYELKYFFSSHLNTSNGEECSSTAIRALIRRIINTENHDKPLSDEKIVKLLGARGIQVARRTVAKYREAMSIPSSSERKRLA